MSALSISSISRTGSCGRGERLPQFAAADVVGDVVDALVAELAVAQPGDRVIFVQALLRLGGRLDVPLDQRRAGRLGDLVGEDGLAGAGLALDQQRAAQRDRGVDRDLQVVGRDVALGAFETLHAASSCLLSGTGDSGACGAAQAGVAVSGRGRRRALRAAPQAALLGQELLRAEQSCARSSAGGRGDAAEARSLGQATSGCEIDAGPRRHAAQHAAGPRASRAPARPPRRSRSRRGRSARASPARGAGCASAASLCGLVRRGGQRPGGGDHRGEHGVRRRRRRRRRPASRLSARSLAASGRRADRIGMAAVAGYTRRGPHRRRSRGRAAREQGGRATVRAALPFATARAPAMRRRRRSVQVRRARTP